MVIAACAAGLLARRARPRRWPGRARPGRAREHDAGRTTSRSRGPRTRSSSGSRDGGVVERARLIRATSACPAPRTTARRPGCPPTAGRWCSRSHDDARVRGCSSSTRDTLVVRKRITGRTSCRRTRSRPTAASSRCSRYRRWARDYDVLALDLRTGRLNAEADHGPARARRADGRRAAVARDERRRPLGRTRSTAARRTSSTRSTRSRARRAASTSRWRRLLRPRRRRLDGSRRSRRCRAPTIDLPNVRAREAAARGAFATPRATATPAPPGPRRRSSSMRCRSALGASVVLAPSSRSRVLPSCKPTAAAEKGSLPSTA